MTVYFDIAKENCATVAAGGVHVDGPGFFARPTPFYKCHKSDAHRARRNLWAGFDIPSVFNRRRRFADCEWHGFGLIGYAWTNDLTRAFRFTDKLEAGVIWVHSENMRHLPTPFGGVKNSGIDRDGSDWSFEFYMEQEHLGLANGEHKTSRLGTL